MEKKGCMKKACTLLLVARRRRRRGSGEGVLSPLLRGGAADMMLEYGRLGKARNKIGGFGSGNVRGFCELCTGRSVWPSCV